jgi:hypothetical protein
MTAGGALTAGAVTVSGNALEAQAGLKVSAGTLEAKAGMTAGGALTAGAVTVSGNALEAQAGLKVSAGTLEAKAGMIVRGILTVKEKIAVTVEGGTLNVGNGLNVGPDKFVVNSNGEATFDEKAGFKKGLNVTGTLEVGGNLLVVDQKGNVGINTNYPEARLHVDGDIKMVHGRLYVGANYSLHGFLEKSPQREVIKFEINHKTPGSDYFTPVVWLESNKGGWKDLSSRLFKKNIVTISDVLSKLDQIRGVYFDWIDGQLSVPPGVPKERNIGMIAEEVLAVFPELVSHNVHENREILGLAYGNFTAVLVQAVKELNAMNQSLSDRVKSLEESAIINGVNS